MAPNSGGTVPVKSSKACVVYDPDTGQVHHIHQVVTFEGGREPTEQEIETRAVALLQAKGRKTGKLHFLHMAHDAVEPFRRYAVDTKTRKLVTRDK